MDYMSMGYQQMLQVLLRASVCHVAAAAGTPCLVPLCCSFYMDGCTPVLELHCQGEEELLTALEQNPTVAAAIWRSVRGGTEWVLLQGQATVVQPDCGCAACPQRHTCHRQCCPQRPAVVRVTADTLTGRCLRECPENCGKGY